MNKTILALAIVLVAAAPAFAAKKTAHHATHKMHHVAKPKADTSPNANTYKLLANMFK